MVGFLSTAVSFLPVVDSPQRFTFLSRNATGKRLDEDHMTVPVPAAQKAGKEAPPADAAASEVDNARSPLIAGFIGSMFLVFGSLGVGWLAPVSELRRLPLFIWMRTEGVGVALSIVLLAVVGMMVFWSLL